MPEENDTRQNAGAVDLKQLADEIADSREINIHDVRPVIDELSRRGMIKNELIKPEEVGE